MPKPVRRDILWDRRRRGARPIDFSGTLVENKRSPQLLAINRQLIGH
jgi:hypothetical protein